MFGAALRIVLILNLDMFDHRSDNALGSILLNIMVDTARIDKVADNNILLATVPNPPIPGEKTFCCWID